MTKRVCTGRSAGARSFGQLRQKWVALCAVCVVGCSGRPAAIHPPDINPHALGEAAVQQYDTNGDGAVSGDELKSAGSLRFSRARIDSDNDGKLTAEEIANFANRHWLQARAGIIRTRCKVTMGGRPLDGATVTLEPEEFMDGAVHSASGVTRRRGLTSLDVSEEDRPHPNAHGVQAGLYLVRISKVVNGREVIPPKYNVETTLGCEIAQRASYSPGPIHFDLHAR